MSISIEFARIDPPKDPLQLYQSWADGYIKNQKNGIIVMNLATASKSGRVSNRSLMLREVSNNQFIFTTNTNSKKIHDIEENPNVGLCFFFDYEINDKRIFQQIRVEGQAVKLPSKQAERLFDMEAQFAKVRYHIVEKQGKPIDWNMLKEKMDTCLAANSDDDSQLKCGPDYYVAYGVVPEYMDFYYSYNSSIADRICYTKDKNKEWRMQRITP